MSLASCLCRFRRSRRQVQMSESMNSKVVSELPLNGRSASDVAALEPGVIRARASTIGGGANGYGNQQTIFGSRPRQNNSSLDGIRVNDYANGPLGSAIGINLGVDALERLSVLTFNDRAEYGRSSGGYISTSTRSGTNGFHGSVFEYFQETVRWTLKITSTMTSLPSAAINLAGPPEDQFGRTAPSFLATMREFANPKALPMCLPVPSAAARILAVCARFPT